MQDIFFPALIEHYIGMGNCISGGSSYVASTQKKISKTKPPFMDYGEWCEKFLGLLEQVKQRK